MRAGFDEKKKLKAILSFYELPEIDERFVYQNFLDKLQNQLGNERYKITYDYNEGKKLTCKVASQKFGHDGRALRLEHLKELQNLAQKFDITFNLANDERYPPSLNAVLNIESHDFLPVVKLMKYMQDLNDKQDLKQDLCEKIFEVATNLDKTMYGLDSKVKIAIENVRKTNDQSYSSGVYNYTKAEDWWIDCLPDELKPYQYFRVSIRHRDHSLSPFWISIDVITGEFVIRTREDEMFLDPDSTILKQSFTDIKEMLKRDERFQDILLEDGDFFYENGNNLYFTQNAFKHLAEKKTQEDLVCFEVDELPSSIDREFPQRPNPNLEFKFRKGDVASNPVYNDTYLATLAKRSTSVSDQKASESAIRVSKTLIEGFTSDQQKSTAIIDKILKNINYAKANLKSFHRSKDSQDINDFVMRVIEFAQKEGGVGNAGEAKWNDFTRKKPVPEGFSFDDAKRFSYNYQQAAKEAGVYTGREESLKTGPLIGARLKRIPEDLNKTIVARLNNSVPSSSLHR
jgi:hypothetical protein